MAPRDDLKPTNPKDAIGSDKLPLHLFPAVARAEGALALLDGAMKYGRMNWRVAGVRASIYYDAACRHLDAWFEGEDAADDSGVTHLGHALACLAILVDAKAAGMLRDDRAYPGGYKDHLKSIADETPRIKKRHADKSPKHYTKEDAVCPARTSTTRRGR